MALTSMETALNESKLIGIDLDIFFNPNLDLEEAQRSLGQILTAFQFENVFPEKIASNVAYFKDVLEAGGGISERRNDVILIMVTQPKDATGRDNLAFNTAFFAVEDSDVTRIEFTTTIPEHTYQYDIIVDRKNRQINFTIKEVTNRRQED